MAQAFAKFWKCALQVNPASYALRYQGKNVDHGLSEDKYNKAIAARCVKNKIQVVGIADHGCVDGVDKLRAALESEGVTVFPGFEIASTEKVHMVCLYPSGTTTGELNRHLGSLGLAAGAAGTSPSKLGCLNIADVVLKQGGFWYAAHITGANGLLRLNQDGGGLAHIWRECESVFAAQIPGDVASIPDFEIQNILRNKNAQYKRNRPIALLNSKDVRRPEDLENERTCAWIKMTAPTLEALRLACRDPLSRIRLSHEVNPSYYSRIERISIRRGYLNEIDLDLSPNLNAIVGGRGTGKSTLIEGIRYVLQRVPENKDALAVHRGIIDANFAKEKASIEIEVTSFQQNDERYIISRHYGEPAKVLDENRNVLRLSPKDVLPRVEVYGQNELLSIVKSESAKAALLGRFLPDDSDYRKTTSDLELALKKNRQEIDQSEEKLDELVDKLEQLPALLDKERSFKKLGMQKELEQVQRRELQRAYVDAIGSSIEELSIMAEELESHVGELEVPEMPLVRPPNTLKAFSNLLSTATRATAKAAANARATIKKVRSEYDEARKSFDHEISVGEQAFNAAVNKLPVLKGKSVAQLTAEYKKVSSEIVKLKPLGNQKTTLESKLVSLQENRSALLTQLAAARSVRWTALAKAVKGLNRRLDGQIRVEFEPERIRDPAKEFLLGKSLEGVGEKRLSWIADAESFSISDLVENIRSGAKALLKKFRKAGMQAVVADALAGLGSSDLRELEEIELPEKMELLLNLSREKPNYREVGSLSTGQQCTAILHLLLLDNPDPLIIDQPEDNLDNAFIADHIVSELRSNKTKRQFLFATHNANIPVFGDAEWIGVMQEECAQARLCASGSIDAPDVKELAANILEGGREAFNRRKEKYGL